MHPYLTKANEALDHHNFPDAKSWFCLLIDSTDPTISLAERNYALYMLTYISLKYKQHANAIDYIKHVDTKLLNPHLLPFTIPVEVEERLRQAHDSPFALLPEEIVLRIFTILAENITTLNASMKVSRSWHRMISQEDSLWQTAFVAEIQYLNSQRNKKQTPTVQTSQSTDAVQMLEVPPTAKIISLTKTAQIPFRVICRNLVEMGERIFTTPNKDLHLTINEFTLNNNCLGIMLTLQAGHIDRKVTISSANNKTSLPSGTELAATFGKQDCLRLFLSMQSNHENSAEAHHVNGVSANYLLQAVKYNQQESVSIILRHRPHFNLVAEAFLTALSVNKEVYTVQMTETQINYDKAIENNNLRIISALFMRGVPFSNEEQRSNAINVCISFNDHVFLKQLLADPISMTTRIAAIQEALNYSALECLELLFTAELSEETQKSFVGFALENGTDIKCILVLFDKLTVPNKRIYILYECTRHCSTYHISRILKPEDDETIKSTIITFLKKWAPRKLIDLLSYALNDAIFMKLLIEHGVIAELQKIINSITFDDECNTITQQAVYHGRKDELESLIKAGIDINRAPYARSHCAGTPMMLAVWLGKEDCLQILLAAGAELQHQFPHMSYFGLNSKTRLSETMYGGYTVFHFAIGNYALLNLLLSAPQFTSSLLSLRSDEGYTAFHLAAKRADLRSMRMLLMAGAKTNTRSAKGISPFYEVLKMENPEHIILLLDHCGTIYTTAKERDLILNKIREAKNPSNELMSLYIKILFHRDYLGNYNQKIYFSLLLELIEHNKIEYLTHMLIYLPNYFNIVTDQLKLAFLWMSGQSVRPSTNNEYKQAVKLALEKKHWFCAKQLLEVKADSIQLKKSRLYPLKAYLKEQLYAKGLWELTPILDAKFDVQVAPLKLSDLPPSPPFEHSSGRTARMLK